jgi:large subunit ribosomal protein L9
MVERGVRAESEVATMEVILLDNVRNLGTLGDQVKVKPGYGRNYLVPQGKAVRATPDNIKAFEERRAELERQAAEARQAAQGRADTIANVGTITLRRKSADEGKLFGSIAATDVAEALSEAGASVERKEVVFPEGAIRQTGEYQVEIHLHFDVVQPVTLVVEAE